MLTLLQSPRRIPLNLLPSPVNSISQTCSPPTRLSPSPATIALPLGSQHISCHSHFETCLPPSPKH